jgi:hypothetical protein
MTQMLGCGTHYTVRNAPVPADQLGSYRISDAETPVVVQFADFTVGKVDTQYPEREKDDFRRAMAVFIPNLLQEQAGKRQVFSAVTRSSRADSSAADYVVTGRYDHFERLGTRGRQWIPFYGTFGGKINEAWVKGELAVAVVNGKTGVAVLERTFQEEHRDRTSIYQSPNVGYLQADHAAEIVGAIVTAVQTAEGQAAVPAGADVAPPRGSTSDAATERLRTLEGLREQGLLSDREYDERRQRILDEALGF